MNVLSTGTEWVTEKFGGLARYQSDFLASWIKEGHQARALVRSANAKMTSSFPGYVRPIYDLGGSRLQYLDSWRRVVREELTKQKYDLFNPHFAFYAQSYLNTGNDLPVVTNFQGPWAYEAKVEAKRGNSIQEKIKFHIRHHIEKRLYRKSDQFIVLSQEFSKILQMNYEIPAERVHVIPGAVDVVRFNLTEDRLVIRQYLKIPEQAFVFVAIRRLARRMGHANLIRAFAKVAADHPDAFLLLVGDGDIRGELEQLVKDLQLTNRVRFTGRVADNDLSKYYQVSDISVVPTLAFEGFGLVTVESMACGTPVMGTPIGGTYEILGGFDNRLLFRSSEPMDIAEGLNWAISHRMDLPDRVVTRNHVLKHYTWDVVISQINEVFELAVKGV